MAEDPVGGSAAPEAAPEISMQGLSVEVPNGWEARIRTGPTGLGGVVKPVVHAATVPLVPDRADYGGGVVEALGSEDVFVALVEFGDEAVDSELFPRVEEFPAVEAGWFHPRQLQRVIPGQGGAQRFFTYNGRAFCLYVVLGSYLQRSVLAPMAAHLVDGIRVETG